MMGHWNPTFDCLEKLLTVGADCEGVGLWWLAVAHSNASCMAATSSANDEVNTAPRRSLRWGMVGSAGSPRVTITPAPPSLVPAVAELSV